MKSNGSQQIRNFYDSKPYPSHNFHYLHYPKDINFYSPQINDNYFNSSHLKQNYPIPKFSSPFENDHFNREMYSNPYPINESNIYVNERSLKNLSQRVQEIVFKKKKTNYKDVAEYLINKINQCKLNNFVSKLNVNSYYNTYFIFNININ